MQAAASALQGYREHIRRHVGSLGVAVVMGAAGASACYYLYHRVSTALTDSLLPGTSSAATGTGTSKQRLEKDADENLANHFQAVQAISDSTTLPQMLEELERHLNRAASLDALILRLRQVKGGGEAAAAEKHALWRELAEAGFARTAAAIWLLPLLQLLLRVQLNILGRQLFMESNLLEPRGRPGAWRAHALHGPAAELVRVGKGVQEQFLEYAHYLPERSVQAAVERQRVAAFSALEGIQLTQPVSVAEVLGCLEGMSAEFEEAVALGGGWAQLALPSPEDAQRYFTSFRRAPPDNSALVPGPQVAIPDEDIVRALVEEVVHVMSGPLFDAALKASVAEVMRQVRELLLTELGVVSRLPLATTVPRVSKAGDALLKPDGPVRESVLSAIAELPEVQRLAASVYSFGPA